MVECGRRTCSESEELLFGTGVVRISCSLRQLNNFIRQRLLWILQVLVVREKQYGTLWKLPGGLADLGEDFPDTAQREVWEETGQCI